jgi:hypothetical protein
LTRNSSRALAPSFTKNPETTIVRRRLSTWSRVFFVTLGTSAAAVVAGVFVVERFPWQIVYNDFSLARSSQFLTPWPQAAMDEEQQERKRLRRFARAEVDRRFGIHLRRMENLYTPLFDPFLDQGVQLTHAADTTAPQPRLMFPWPGLETARRVGEAGASKPVTYFATTTPHGVQLVEGISVGTGEEVRFTFPIVRNRRTLDFVALPLAPGTVRGLLGQYSWVRNFAESDIHKFQTVSIPLNDTTATTLRVASQSARFLMLGAAVSQWDKSGRMPVQVGGRSPLWKPDPALVSKERLRGEAEVALAEPAQAVTAEGDAPEADAVEAATADTAAEAATAEAASAEGTEGSAKETVVAVAAPAAVSAGKKDEEPAKVIVDPIEETANGQRVTPGGRTAALGYNVLLLQLGDIPEALLASKGAFRAIAPNISGLLATSARSKSNSVPQDGPVAIFHRTVLSSGTESVATENGILLQKHLGGAQNFNLYARLRNFGYKVVAVAPAPFLGLPEEVAAGREVPALERRWLGAADWPFAQRNKELDDQNQPATGLDAIFQTNTTPLAPPLTDGDFQKIGAYLGEIGRAQENFPDWRANEIFLPDVQGLYLPAAVDFLQRWSKENGQTRFFLHMHLDASLGQTRASMKDLFQVLKSRKFLGLASSAEAERLARLVLIDRAVGQILSTLKARRLTHRTVVGLLMPHERTPGKETRLSTALAIPGLIPTEKPVDASGVDDLVATMLTSVGIPLGRNVVDSIAPFPGLAWDAPGSAAGMAAGRSHSGPIPSLKRYVVFLRAGETGCAPLSWKTTDDVFGFESSHPVVEFPGSRGGEHFRVFPCSLPGSLVRISWFQAPAVEAGSDGGQTVNPEATEQVPGAAVAPTPSAQSLARQAALARARERERERERERQREERERDAMSLSTLRGYFVVRDPGGDGGPGSRKETDFPLFFFGRNALRLGALPMTLSSLSEDEIARVFDVDEREVPDSRLAGDILDLSEFNKGVARQGEFATGERGEKIRSALLVFRHAVLPDVGAAPATAEK